MKKSRLTEERIAYVLRQAEGGSPVADVRRGMGISEATFYVWKKKYASMGGAEYRSWRALEASYRFSTLGAEGQQITPGLERKTSVEPKIDGVGRSRNLEAFSAHIRSQTIQETRPTRPAVGPLLGVGLVRRRSLGSVVSVGHGGNSTVPAATAATLASELDSRTEVGAEAGLRDAIVGWRRSVGTGNGCAKPHFLLPRRYPGPKRKRPARRQAVVLFGCGGKI